MNCRFYFCTAVVGALFSTAASADITFASYGGQYQAAQERTTLVPFTQKTGINVQSENYSGGVAQMKAQYETKNVTWDVVDLQLAEAMRGCDEGFLEKISPSDLAPAKTGDAPANDFLPDTLNECFVGNVIYSSVVAYNKIKVAGEPTKIADFFDLKKYPGKRGLRKSPEVAMEWALLADGVKPEDVYKVLATADGQARAFKKLDTIKASVVWWEAGAQPPQLLNDGEVVMTSTYVNRVSAPILENNRPFAFVWDGQVKNIEGYAIVKGTKNLKQAKEFLRYATDSERLAAMASASILGPVRKSSMALVDSKILPYLPTTAKNLPGSVTADYAFWADHSDDLNKKFATWLARR